MPDIKDLGRDLRKLAKEIRRAGLSAAEEIAKVGRDESIRHSQGRLTSAKLAELDHPYARRHGSPQRPTEIVNQQTGLFKRSWVLSYLNLPNGTKVVVIRNTVPYASFLEEGTRKMFSRPIDVAVELRIANVAPFIVRRRIEAAMTSGPFTK